MFYNVVTQHIQTIGHIYKLGLFLLKTMVFGSLLISGTRYHEGIKNWTF